MFDGIHGTPISGATISGSPISGRSADWHNAGNYISPDSEFIFDGRALPTGLTYSRASGATFVDAGGNLVEVGANVPRYQDGGLLIERIPSNNGVRNPRAEGLSGTTTYGPGSPSLGTNVGGAVNWQFATRLSGLSVDVSPITALGRTGMRVRWYGTTGPSPSVDTLEFDARNVIGAQTGVPVTGSLEVRLVSGTFPLTVFNPRILTFNNAGTLIDNNSKPGADTPTSTLKTLTHTWTPTAGVGTNGWAIVGLVMSNWPASTAVDFTLDIFCPQLETNSFPTSRILPPPGSPAATTRAADILDINPALIDLDRSSIAMRFRIERGGVGVTAAAGQTVLGLVNTAATDSFRVITLSGQTLPVARIGQAGTFLTAATGAVGSGVFQTVAAAWSPNSTTAAFDGAAPGTAAVRANPPLNAAQVGNESGAATPGNLTLQYLRIWRGRRLSVAQVQQQSARTT